MDNEELLKQLGEKIICGEELMQNVSKNKGVDGIDKLKKKIKQERNFILKIVNSKEAKKEHLLCTNLQHFEALVLCLQSSCNPVAVLQYFGLSKADGSFKRICVDIVAENGKHWIKVIARNPRAISQLYSGAGEFGQRSIIDHAVEYLECAQQHPHFFIPPKVTSNIIISTYSS
ncbi:UPF0415 protein [Blattella germanica]|nr:UPF0415 protein [Blattella germanica]